MHRSFDVSALNRRALLQRAICLAGGSALGLSWEAFAEARTGQTRFFTPAQFAILDAVTDAMIPATDTPGARGAGVPQSIDALMLNWASKPSRTSFVALLKDFDRTALAQEGKAFLALALGQRTAFLARYDSVNLPQKRAYNAIAIGGAKSPPDPPYVRFKEIVATVYYLSEVGATQELRYEHDPGVFDPAMKVTPETRAWAIPA